MSASAHDSASEGPGLGAWRSCGQERNEGIRNGTRCLVKVCTAVYPPGIGRAKQGRWGGGGARRGRTRLLKRSSSCLAATSPRRCAADGCVLWGGGGGAGVNDRVPRVRDATLAFGCCAQAAQQETAGLFEWRRAGSLAGRRRVAALLGQRLLGRLADGRPVIVRVALAAAALAAAADDARWEALPRLASLLAKPGEGPLLLVLLGLGLSTPLGRIAGGAGGSGAAGGGGAGGRLHVMRVVLARLLLCAHGRPGHVLRSGPVALLRVLRVLLLVLLVVRVRARNLREGR